MNQPLQTGTKEIEHIYAPGIRGWVARFEDGFGAGLMMLIAIIPVLEALMRGIFRAGIPDAALIHRHLIVVITFVGAAIASKDNRHLSISFGLADRKDVLGIIAGGLNGLVSGVMIGTFFLASISYLVQAIDPESVAWVIPILVFTLAFPIGLLIVIVRSFPKSGGWIPKALYLLGTVLSLFVSAPSLTVIFAGPDGAVADWLLGLESAWYEISPSLLAPGIIVLILSAFAGTPLFVVLGGVAVLLFSANWEPSSPVIDSGYVMLKGVNIPAIALFTFAGFILSESGVGERFVRLFKALFGRVRGGVIIVSVLVSAFFTTFTGASGVTILALGTLLYSVVTKTGNHSDKLGIGLITSSGSIGLLLPPSLAVILYGAVASVDAGTSILELFKAGVMPGLLMIIGMIVLGIIMTRKDKLAVTEKPPKGELWQAFKASFWELLLPIVIIVTYFTGFATIIETSAFAVLYAFIIEVFVKKEINGAKFLRLSVKSLVIVGGVLTILTFAQGLRDYFVLAGVPQTLSTWAEANLQSPLVFLLLLNIVLFIVGCFMDIYSAILVIVPLIVPIAAAFGINQYHLAMIFLSNMAVGFITPPVGMNLFLAAYRFEKPLIFLYKSVVPFFLVQVIIVMIVTYVPWFSTALLSP